MAKDMKTYLKDVGQSCGQQAATVIVGAAVGVGVAKFLEWRDKKKEEKKAKKEAKKVESKNVDEMSTEDASEELAKFFETEEGKRILQLTEKVKS